MQAGNMAELQPTIFISYASEDVGAAAQLCEALRAAGFTVWFDRNELRGGDAWDHSIREQIRCCSLFIPIISQHTEVRAEAYFRLEWKLAIDRSYLMTDDQKFLLPVVIDGTHGMSARVPDRLRQRQWTHDFPGLRRRWCGHDAGRAGGRGGRGKCADEPVAAPHAGAVTRLSGDQCAAANAARRCRRRRAAGTSQRTGALSCLYPRRTVLSAIQV